MTEETEDFDGVEIRVPKSRSKKRQSEDLPPVIENDEPIPLFPNLDKDARNVITLVRVWKRTPPNDGFKGDISASATLDFIAKRFGNGIYDLEALNQNQQVIRRNQNIKVDLSGMDPSPARPAIPPDSGLAERLLDRQATQFENDARRSKELTDATLTVTKTLSTDYATMIREDTKSRLERDREYFSASTQQTMSMMQALLLQTTQMHEQAMSSAREGFQQTMQMMQLQHQQAATMNNPIFLLSLFKEGLAMGQNNVPDEDPLSSVLKSGVSGLGHIKDMMSLQSAMAPPTLPVGKSAVLPNPERKAGGKRPPPLTNDELRELVRLKKLASEKGHNFHAMIKQAQEIIRQNGANPEESPEDDSESEDSDGASDMEGGEAKI